MWDNFVRNVRNVHIENVTIKVREQIMNRVFLSHSNQDNHYVGYIAEKLGKDVATYDVFSFEEGQKTRTEIEKGIEESDLIVFFLSNSSLDSSWVQEEMRLSYDALQKGRVKAICPIIIDSQIMYNDKRIPSWLNSGVDSYLLRYISSPKIAYRKIRDQLYMSTPYEKSERIYIGHEDLIKKFDERYYISPDSSCKCIIACGMEDIGRESFIRECIKIPKTFSDKYDPVVISVERNDSIDVIISKLQDCGWVADVEHSMAEINEMSMDEKINCLSKILASVQNAREFVIFRDLGALIQNGNISWWLTKALSNIRNELTIGIVTHMNIHRSRGMDEFYIENIDELDPSGKLKLLDVLSQKNGLKLDRDDIKYFLEILTGHPRQIIYCVQKIKKESLEEVKRNSYQISEFLSNSTIDMIDGYLLLLKYDEVKKKKFMSYLAFLASYSNVPIKEVLQINKLDPDYEEFYRDMLSFCILRKTGLNNDLLTTSPSVVDYIDRSRINLPSDISNFLKEEYRAFRKDLESEDLDDYCYSQIERNLKGLVLDNPYESTAKYIYPSIILKAVIELYNKKSYDKLLNICENCLGSISQWDHVIRQTLYFYYAMTLVRKRDTQVFNIINKKVDDIYILDKVQADFICGFYYKLSGRYEEAIVKFESCLEDKFYYARARRELVEAYIMVEDFDVAIELARLNYEKFPDNIFNIFQYFNCLIRVTPIQESKVKSLLEKAKIVDKLPTASKQFYPQMKSLYQRFIEKNLQKALSILIESKSCFDNEIYYYRDIFDINEEIGDTQGMKESYEKLKYAVGDDESFLPLLRRREIILEYYNCKDLDRVNHRIGISGLSSREKERLMSHIKSIRFPRQ